MIDPSRFLGQVRERAAQISLGRENRAVVEIPGHTPIRLERWELEAFTDNGEDGEVFRKAVVLRALARDLTVALERNLDLTPPERATLSRQIPKVLSQCRELMQTLKVEGKIDDDFLSRRYLLTRDHIQDEVDPLMTGFQEAGGDPNGPSSVSGAYARQVMGKLPAGLVGESPQVKLAAIGVFALVLVLFLGWKLWPRVEASEDIDVSAYEGVVTLEKMWKSGPIVAAIVTSDWYAMKEPDRLLAAKDLFARVKQDHEAKRLLLYQPGGTKLAAQLTDKEQKLFPKER